MNAHLLKITAVTDFDGSLTLSYYIFPLYSKRPTQAATVGKQIF